jgi:hypothetical protein
MAAGATYEPIATNTLGSATSTVTFSSIPQGYTDLIVVFNGRGTSGTGLYLQFNGDSNSNYSHTRILGDGTEVISQRGTNNTVGSFLSIISTVQNNVIAQVQNYSNSTTFKTTLARSNNTTGYMGAYVSLWRSTAAINSVTITTGTADTYVAGSTFTLYGIKAA